MVVSRGLQGLVNQINRIERASSTAFEPRDFPPSPLTKAWSRCYLIRLPDLPEPVRYLDLALAFGDSVMFTQHNRGLLATPASDGVWLGICMTEVSSALRHFSRRYDTIVDVGSDAVTIDVAEEIALTRTASGASVKLRRPQLQMEIDIDFGTAVSHYIRVPGVYRHWSVLGDYRAHIIHGDGIVSSSGLCSYEESSVLGPVRAPMHGFCLTYLNLDDDLQLILLHALGVSTTTEVGRVYVRQRGAAGEVLMKGVRYAVQERRSRSVHPLGHELDLPDRSLWAVIGADGDEVLRIETQTIGDYSFGLAKAYCASVDFVGHFRGRAVAGRGSTAIGPTDVEGS